MGKSDINTGLTLLLNEIAKEIDEVSEKCKSPLDAKEFGKIKALCEYGEHLKDFRRKVEDLRKWWRGICSNDVWMNGSKDKIGKRKKLKKGLKTREEEYEIPILEALVELGGKGEVRDVLDRVYEKMKDKLNEYDKEILRGSSGRRGNQTRWRNTALWAIHSMYKKGLLKRVKRGVLEIIEEGRKYYESSKGNSENGNVGGIEG